MDIDKAKKKAKNLQMWKPGQSGNPAGKVRWTRTVKTLFDEAVRKIAAEEKVDANSIEVAIVQKALDKARKGDFRFFKDLNDRNYGKAKEQIDITSGGEKLGTPINVDLSKLDYEELRRLVAKEDTAKREVRE